jgi:uncharacterized coiled-coil protein SlyX
MERFDAVTNRLTDLELLFTHLERQVADLHTVVLRQEQRMEATEKQIRVVVRAMQQPADAPESEDD